MLLSARIKDEKTQEKRFRDSNEYSICPQPHSSDYPREMEIEMKMRLSRAALAFEIAERAKHVSHRLPLTDKQCSPMLKALPSPDRKNYHHFFVGCRKELGLWLCGSGPTLLTAWLKRFSTSDCVASLLFRKQQLSSKKLYARSFKKRVFTSLWQSKKQSLVGSNKHVFFFLREGEAILPAQPNHSHLFASNFCRLGAVFYTAFAVKTSCECTSAKPRQFIRLIGLCWPPEACFFFITKNCRTFGSSCRATGKKLKS